MTRGKIPVLLDSGVRRGTDIFKALALGARAILVSSKCRMISHESSVTHVQSCVKNLNQFIMLQKPVAPDPFIYVPQFIHNSANILV